MTEENKTTQPQGQTVSLEQLELRTRKIVDELNGIVSFLCKNLADAMEKGRKVQADNAAKK